MNSLQQKFSIKSNYLGTNSVLLKRVDCNKCQRVNSSPANIRDPDQAPDMSVLISIQNFSFSDGIPE